MVDDGPPAGRLAVKTSGYNWPLQNKLPSELLRGVAVGRGCRLLAPFKLRRPSGGGSTPARPCGGANVADAGRQSYRGSSVPPDRAAQAAIARSD